jgi:hypothetical protein
MIGFILVRQNHLYVNVFLTGIPLFKVPSEDSALLASQKNFSSLSAVRTTCHHVWTLIYSLFHPSRRRAIPFGRRQNKHHPSGPFTISRSFCYSLHPSGRLNSPSRIRPVIDQLQIFFPSSYKGRLLQPSRRRRFSSGRAHT